MRKISNGCTLDCFDCCKFNVYVEDNTVIKIEGDKEHPYTKGFICKKGMAHLQRLNHKDRIYTPLLKVNDQWQEISFEEAIEIMGEKLKFYKDMYGVHSILNYTQFGSGSVLKGIVSKFFDFFGGCTKDKGGPCWSAGIYGTKYDFGDISSHALEDMLNSKSIFIWGKNPAYTTIHTMQVMRKAKEKGVNIIVIDPIYTQTAKMADKYVCIKPGTDGALAMAMTKIILQENLQHDEFINSYVIGFNEYKEYLNTLDLKYLCEQCRVQEEEVRDLVRLYTEKYSTIQIGYGMQKYLNGGNSVRAINALAAITGQIGFSGGGVNYANRVYPQILNEDPYNSCLSVDNREIYVSKITSFIKESQNYDKELGGSPIKMAVITKSNLLNQLPNLNELEEAFNEIEFKVCFDMFMTDTAKSCDLFIPCTNTLESDDLLYSSMTNPYIIYNEKAVEPKHKLMDEYYFFMELAMELAIENYPYIPKKEYLEKVIEPLKSYDENISLEKLKYNYFTIHKPIAWENKKFKTPSEKFELYSERAKKEGISAIPIYFRPEVNKGKTILKSNADRNRYDENDFKNTYKFRLLTNHSRDSLFSQHFMDKEGMAQAYINEKMALDLNLEHKEKVNLQSENGSIEVEINMDNSVCDEVVKMYIGWWKKHGNPNFLTHNGCSDMGGQITYNETMVNIIKIN